MKLSAAAIVSQLANRFGPINIKEFCKSFECLNNIDEAHAQAHADNNMSKAYFVFDVRSHSEQSRSEDKHKILGNSCESCDIAR